MGPKKASDSIKVKRKVVKTTKEVKNEIKGKHEDGVHMSNLALQFGLVRSSVCICLKNKKATENANAVKDTYVMFLIEGNSSKQEHIFPFLFSLPIYAVKFPPYMYRKVELNFPQCFVCLELFTFLLC